MLLALPVKADTRQAFIWPSGSMSSSWPWPLLHSYSQGTCGVTFFVVQVLFTFQSCIILETQVFLGKYALPFPWVLFRFCSTLHRTCFLTLSTSHRSWLGLHQSRRSDLHPLLWSASQAWHAHLASQEHQAGRPLVDAANDRGELHAVRSAEHAAVMYPVLVDGGHTRRGHCLKLTLRGRRRVIEKNMIALRPWYFILWCTSTNVCGNSNARSSYFPLMFVALMTSLCRSAAMRDHSVSVTTQSLSWKSLAQNERLTHTFFHTCVGMCFLHL